MIFYFPFKVIKWKVNRVNIIGIIRKKWRKKREEEKAKSKETKLKVLEDELEEVEASFDIYLNPYVDPFPHDFAQPYFQKLNKFYELIYDIDNIDTLGTEAHAKEREKFRSEQRKEWDLLNRIHKWRFFRNTILIRKGREPTRTEWIFNNVWKPKEIDPESEHYRPDLEDFAKITEDDPFLDSITTAEDWAREDEEDFELHPEDYAINLEDYDSDGY